MMDHLEFASAITRPHPGPEFPPYDGQLIVRYDGRGRPLSHYDAEQIVRILLTELRWIDPANPTAAFVKEALQRDVLRWPSLLMRFRLAKSRIADGSIAAQWSERGKPLPQPGNIPAVQAAEHSPAPSQSVHGHHHSSAAADHDLHRHSGAGQQSTAIAPSPRLSILRPLRASARFLSSFVFLRGDSAQPTIAEGDAAASVNSRGGISGGRRA